MKVLFIGGTGLISSASTRLAVERGIDLFILNRGTDPDGARTIFAKVWDLYRAIFERVKARPYLERLEAATARGAKDAPLAEDKHGRAVSRRPR